MSDCYYDTQGCTVCPAIPAQPGAPARIDSTPIAGWDAGATSVKAMPLYGYYSFKLRRSHGVVTGLSTRAKRASSVESSTISHGVYAFQIDGSPVFCIVENGAVVHGPVPYTPDDLFFVYRLGSLVEFRSTDELIFASDKPLFGPAVAAASMYMSGDAVIDPEFGVYTAEIPPADPVVTGEGAATLRVSGKGGVVGGGGAVLFGGSAASFFMPAYSYGSGVISFSALGDLSLHVVGDAAATLTLGAKGGVAGGAGKFLLGARGGTTDLNSCALVQSPGYMFLLSGAPFVSVGDTVAAATNTSTAFVLLLREVLRASDRTDALARLELSLAASVHAGDTAGVVYEALIAAGVDASALTSAQFSVYAALADELTARADGDVHYSGSVSIAVALAASDMARLGYDITAAATIDVVDAFVSRYTIYLDMLDALEAQADLTAAATITMLLDDSVAADADLAAQMTFDITLLDGADFTVRIKLGDDTYVGYAMNTETGAVSEYDNFDANSFARFRNQYLCATDEGVFILDGDDDDGLPIAASVVTGLSDLGSRQLKHVLKAWFGYTADGSLVFKVMTTDRREKKENWYKLSPIDSDVPTDNATRVSKGLQSLYWQFGVTNIDGADFGLDTIKLLPMQLTRRKRGRG